MGKLPREWNLDNFNLLIKSFLKSRETKSSRVSSVIGEVYWLFMSVTGQFDQVILCQKYLGLIISWLNHLSLHCCYFISIVFGNKPSVVWRIRCNFRCSFDISSIWLKLAFHFSHSFQWIRSKSSIRGWLLSDELSSFVHDMNFGQRPSRFFSPHSVRTHTFILSCGFVQIFRFSIVNFADTLMSNRRLSH